MTNPEPPNKKTLLDKHLFLVEATTDRDLSAGDIAVLAQVMERYRDDWGNARASYTHLQRKTNLSRRGVINSAQRLIDARYLHLDLPGLGTRAAQYSPVWSKNSRSVELDCTTSSVEPDCNTLLNPAATLAPPVLQTAAIQLPLPNPPTGAVTVGGENMEPEGVGTPPPGAAPDGAGQGVPPQDSFEALFREYGVNKERHAARLAFNKLAPAADEYVQLMTAAKAWRENYDAIGRHPTYRKLFSTWVEREHYLDDLPEAQVDRKAAAITKARAKRLVVSPQVLPPSPPSVTAATTFAPMVAKVVATDVAVDADDGNSMSVEFSVVAGEHEGQRFGRVIRYGSVDGQTKAEARSELASLCIAAGVRGKLTDTDVLIGALLSVSRQRGGRLHFAPAAANDDQQPHQGGARLGAL